MSLKLLSLKDVKQCITMKQAIDAMEAAFTQLGRNQVNMPLRTSTSIDEEKALTLTMPGYLAEDKVLGLKVASIFPNNLAKHLPSITGFIMLLDAHTGEPKVLMDASYLTALRTGAVSGLATKYFSRDNARHVAIIGSGTQALTQFEAVATVRPIERVSIWSRNIENAEKFAKQIDPKFDTKVYEWIPSALKDADIICTATNSTEPLIQIKDIAPHVHINAVGSHTPSMQEISIDVLGKSVVIADQLKAVLKESGEIIRAIEQKKLKEKTIIEIGTWLLDKKSDYKNQTTVFKSVGLAIQDLSVAEVVYQNALKNDLGLDFALN